MTEPLDKLTDLHARFLKLERELKTVRAARSKAVVEARRKGVKVAAISDALGITKARVAQIAGPARQRKVSCPKCGRLVRLMASGKVEGHRREERGEICGQSNRRLPT